MKKFTKITLIIAGILVAIGLVCVTVAFSRGLTTRTLVQLARDSYFSFDEEGFHFSIGSIEENANKENDGDKTSNYEVAESFQDLDIEFGAGELEARYADVANVEVKETGLSNLKVDVKENTLVIREKTKVNININMDDLDDRSLVVLIPNGMKLREVDIEIGAAKAEIMDLLADEISITVGAGEAEISNITARQFELEVGAGEANVTQLFVDALDVNAGLGQVNITLNGVQEEYNYSVECDIGTVVVGENSYSGLGEEQNVRYEGATKKIEIDCGIGKVKVQFQK